MDASLTVTPIGVGAAYTRAGEVQSSYLVRTGRTSVCLDLGAGALPLLQQQVRVEELDAIVISHLHPDHCVGLFSLRVYLAYGPGRGTRVRLIGPAELLSRLAAFSPGDDWEQVFTFESLEPEGGELSIGDLTLRFAPVPHSGLTFAFRCEFGGSAVTYSADCRRGDALAELASGSDVLIADVGDGPGPSGPGSVHMSAADAVEAARAAGVGRLLLTHCFPDHDRDAVLAAARAGHSDGDVEWAEPGREVSVSAV